MADVHELSPAQLAAAIERIKAGNPTADDTAMIGHINGRLAANTTTAEDYAVIHATSDQEKVVGLVRVQSYGSVAEAIVDMSNLGLTNSTFSPAPLIPGNRAIVKTGDTTAVEHTVALVNGVVTLQAVTDTTKEFGDTDYIKESVVDGITYFTLVDTHGFMDPALVIHGDLATGVMTREAADEDLATIKALYGARVWVDGAVDPANVSGVADGYYVGGDFTIEDDNTVADGWTVNDPVTFYKVEGGAITVTETADELDANSFRVVPDWSSGMTTAFRIAPDGTVFRVPDSVDETYVQGVKTALQSEIAVERGRIDGILTTIGEIETDVDQLETTLQTTTATANAANTRSIANDGRLNTLEARAPKVVDHWLVSGTGEDADTGHAGQHAFVEKSSTGLAGTLDIPLGHAVNMGDADNTWRYGGF